MKIAVVGAGIMGMSAAYFIKETFPHFDVSVYAEKMSPHTTSDGAAGICVGAPVEKNSREKVNKWVKATVDYAHNIIRTDENAHKMGLSIVHGYFLSSTGELEISDWKDCVLNHHKLEESELLQFPDEIKSGYLVTTVFIECSKYIPWIAKLFKQKGGQLIEEKIECLDELQAYDIIINCSGLGARYLVNDDAVKPVRGHVIRIKAPWVKEFIRHVDNDDRGRSKHILVNQDTVVIGGLKEKDCIEPEPREEDREWIISEAKRFLPSLKNAEMVSEWVGFRPSRPTVRLEKEIWKFKTPQGEVKLVPVIHNYGHSAHGVSLFYGCTQEVLELVKSCISCKSRL